MASVVRSVDPGSPAEKAGIRPGDTLLKLNGNPIVDVLDYKYFGYEPRLHAELRGADGSLRTVKIKKREGEDPGLTFETYLMDRARSCANNCIFCFVDQMPPGMRKSLYFKDDDTRLSFLLGNYLTLTNLSEREIQRIIDLRISPINISVHTTDPELRVEMLKNRRAGLAIDTMRRLAEHNITMNCQIVACPGINDGPALDRSLEELAAMAPAVNSIAVVPVGLTRFREGLYPLQAYTAATAVALLDQVEAFAARQLEQTGSRLVWCSDEFYLLAGRELPSEDYFEDFAQLDNGVGMLRLLVSEFGRALGLMEPEEMTVGGTFSIATGVSAAPFLRQLVDMAREKCDKINGSVYPIRNVFFGESITVAGLVTGGDLIDQLRGQPLGQRLLIPANMLRAGEQVFLDDVSVADVERELSVTVVPVNQDGYELLDAMCGLETGPGAEAHLPWEETEYYQYNP